MPIYEYQCQSCSHELEKLQKVQDEPLRVCPQCHEPSLKRKISAAGFRLKGSGWYETDFKKGSKKNVAGEPAESSGSDSKPKPEKAPAPAAAPASSSSATESA